MAAGLSDGEYKLGVNDIVVKEGDAQLVSDGTRAGSTLTMDRALRNLIKFTGRKLEDVIRFLTKNQANVLGLDNKGEIAVGKDGDIVILDNKLTPICTVVKGKIVYER